MPTYTFIDKKTGVITEEFLWMSEVEDFMKAHPDLELGTGSASLVDSWRMGRKKPDEAFRQDVLGKIKNFYKNSTIEN